MEYSLNTYLEQGFDVYTSLDPELTKIVYEELKKGIYENKAEFGSAAILDCDTREIIALVNFPTFDPNEFRSITAYNMRPRAVADSFEPGSVMKQFSAAFAIEKNLVRTNAPIYQCTGFATVGDHEFTCENPHGYVNLTTILQKSCNIGMVQVADLFNKNEFYRFLKRFGFGMSPDIPLGEMSSGIFRPSEKWTMLSKYMIAIGQEIGVSTLQLAVASSVIGGQGVFKTPVLVRSVKDLGENTVFAPPLTNYRVLSESSTAELLKMMETVVSENGTAIAAKVEGIPIAGKTGTGQIAGENGKGYFKDLFNSVFVGYLPANKPKYVITIVINRPHGGKHAGGLVAAPVFANVVRRMLTAAPYFSTEQDGK
jgi:cell division protein FtsI/penicillin-binding protein 2